MKKTKKKGTTFCSEGYDCPSSVNKIDMQMIE
jgi:hypothetical protein